jgi:hypothetical protein
MTPPPIFKTCACGGPAMPNCPECIDCWLKHHWGDELEDVLREGRGEPPYEAVPVHRDATNGASS